MTWHGFKFISCATGGCEDHGRVIRARLLWDEEGPSLCDEVSFWSQFLVAAPRSWSMIRLRPCRPTCLSITTRLTLADVIENRGEKRIWWSRPASVVDPTSGSLVHREAFQAYHLLCDWNLMRSSGVWAVLCCMWTSSTWRACLSSSLGRASFSGTARPVCSLLWMVSHSIQNVGNSPNSVHNHDWFEGMHPVPQIAEIWNNDRRCCIHGVKYVFIF